MIKGVQHLLCCRSWSKEVCKTLGQLHLVFYVVVMMRTVCGSQAHLVEQRHAVNQQIHTAAETCGVGQANRQSQKTQKGSIPVLCTLMAVASEMRQKYLINIGGRLKYCFLMHSLNKLYRVYSTTLPQHESAISHRLLFTLLPVVSNVVAKTPACIE